MDRPVVVGVDGSPTSLTAAEYAADVAVARSRPLLVVHGYLHPLGYGVPLNPYDLGVPAPTEESRRMLDRVAAELADARPGLRVAVRQVAGGPGATLVEESRRADLVVVGSRGVGGFAGLLLGSVSGQVTQHGHCPVLVVRPAEQPIPTRGPVLVGVDGSTPGAFAVQLAAEEALRRDADLVLVDEIAAWRDCLPGFDFTTVVADPASSHPRTGWVTQHLPEGLEAGGFDLYLCGPPPMVDAVRRHLDEAGLAPASFHYEKFTPNEPLKASA